MLANSHNPWFNQINRLAHKVKCLVGCLLGVFGLLVAMAAWSSAQSLDQKAELELVSQKASRGAALDSKPGDKPPKVDP
jgi:CHASE1-domain containing sensor protein